MKKLIAIIAVLAGTSAFAQSGEHAGTAGATLAQMHGEKLAKERAVPVNVNQILVKTVQDDRNFNISGKISYTVNGNTLDCEIPPLELEYQRDHEDLCDDREYYPSVRIDGDTKETRIYVDIKHNEWGFDYVIKSFYKKIGNGVAPRVDIQQEAGFLGVKLEGGPF